MALYTPLSSLPVANFFYIFLYFIQKRFRLIKQIKAHLKVDLAILVLVHDIKEDPDEAVRVAGKRLAVQGGERLETDVPGE